MLESLKHIKIPKAKKISHQMSAHEHLREDPFFWLNQRENPEVLDYLESENNYTETISKNFEELQKNIFNEIKNRIKPDDSSPPYKIDDYFYYHRFIDGKEYPLYCRKYKDLEAEEEILLDVNELSKNYNFCEVVNFSPSPDHSKMAFGVDFQGRRIYEIKVWDIENNTFLKNLPQETTGNFEWLETNEAIVYSKQDLQTLRSYQILQHDINNSQNDTLIFEEKDETFHIYVEKSRSRKYIFIVSQSTLSSEYQYANSNTLTLSPKIFFPRQKNHEYEVEHAGDSFFIKSNHNAKNFKIFSCHEESTDLNHWKEFLAHDDKRFIESIYGFENHLILEEKINGLSNLRVIKLSDCTSYDIEFDEEAYVVSMDRNPDFNSDLIRISFESMITPPTIFDYHLEEKSKKVVKVQEVLGGYQPENYESKRLQAPARDGTSIPVSIVYKKDQIAQNPLPLLQYGYGSYGISSDPSFSSAIISLLDRGFIFAIAHIRGGSEKGRSWYEDGKLLKKKNTFFDFIDTSLFLIKEGYTTSDHLYAYGGSAGGLLMGAVMNLRPDLYHGIIATVPFVDVVTTMLDTSIPLTTGEFDEWGNPQEKEFYDYMLSYSPYDNIESKNYPHLLILTGLHDSQVQYWEPAKWTAKLRELKTDHNLLLLKTNMHEGHGGASGRYARFKDTALKFSFLVFIDGSQ